MAGLDANKGEWQVVRRRRRYPDNWKLPIEQDRPRVKPFKPLETRLTYAQAVCKHTDHQTPSPSSRSNSERTTPTSTPPSSPTTPPGTTYYVSPHSPAHLRFPPSPRYPEWRGRCFRCCRRGHSAVACRYPKKCGKCWHDGHTGVTCGQQHLNPAAKPFRPAATHCEQKEPMFDELLTGACPYVPPEMPKHRPSRTVCFLDRDDKYFGEIAQLERAVVLHGQHLEFDIMPDQVAEFAMQTGLVKLHEIRVATLARSRYLIHLPPGLAPTTFINTTPQYLWDQSLSFQPWTPLEEAAILLAY